MLHISMYKRITAALVVCKNVAHKVGVYTTLTFTMENWHMLVQLLTFITAAVYACRQYDHKVRDVP